MRKPRPGPTWVDDAGCVFPISDVLRSAAMELLQQWGGSPRLLLRSFHLTRNHQAKESGGKFAWSKVPRDFWKLHLVYTGVITPPSEMVAEDSGCGRTRLPQLKCQNPSSKTRWKEAELRSPTQWGWVQLQDTRESKGLSVRSFQPQVQPQFCRNFNLLTASVGPWEGLVLGLNISVLNHPHQSNYHLPYKGRQSSFMLLTEGKEASEPGQAKPKVAVLVWAQKSFHWAPSAEQTPLSKTLFFIFPPV